MNRFPGICLFTGCLLTSLFSQPALAQSRRPQPATLQRLQQNLVDLRAAYFESLQSLVKYCQEQGLTDGVNEIRRFQEPPDPTRIRVLSLPKRVEPDVPFNLPPDVRHWQTQLRFHRKDFAKSLYLLSRQVLHAGSPGMAYDLVHELVRHDPDHAEARKLLGYVQLGDEWMTPFAKKMRLDDCEWSPEFGWLKRTYLPRYQAGERLVDGKWVSADKEAILRQDFQHAWEIRTDHYLIRTNYSLERGAELGLALEDFYEFFHQTFAGFFNEPEQLRKIFDGKSTVVNQVSRPFRVNYYRTREEYVQRLQPVFPSIQATNGIYLTGDRTAHFYFDPQGTAEDTLFHEATHQLFYESHLPNRPIADASHFWVVEGIACYLESFRRNQGEFSVGDPGHIRFAGARMNYLDKNYYVPYEEFSQMGSTRFQSAPVSVLAKNYTQAAGLAHFFMQYDSGRYRDAVVTHLSQIYSGDVRKRQGVQGLDVLTNVEASVLDQQYGEWMKSLREAELARQQSQSQEHVPANSVAP